MIPDSMKTREQLIEELQTLRESEKKYRVLFEDMAQGVFYQRADGQLIDCNSAVLEMFGLTREQFLGKTSLDPNWKVIREDGSELPGPEHPSMQALRTGEPVSGTIAGVFNPHKQMYVWLSINAMPQFREGEETPYQVFVTLHDISARKQIEDALQKSEQRFKLAMQATNDGLYDWNLDTNAIYYSPGWKRMLGYEDDELENDLSVWEQLTEPKGVEASWKMLNEMFERKRERFEVEFRMRHKDGHWVDVLSRANAIFDENAKAVRVVGTHIDISERKKAEEALRFSDERTRQYLEVAGVMLIALDSQQNVTLINRKGCEILGYPKAEVLGRNWFDTFLTDEDVSEVKQVFKHIISGAVQQVEYYENSIRRKDGSTRMIAWHNSVLRDSAGKIIGLFSSGEDISERKRAEERLQESEIRFRELFDTIPSGVAFYQVKNDGASGKDYIITDFNKASLRIEGMEKKDVIGKSLADLRPEIDDYGLIPIFQQVWKTGEAAFYPATIYIDEHYANYYENRVFRLPSGEIVAVYDDVTVRKRAEEALRQVNQKLELRIEARTRELREAQEKLLRQEKLAVLGQLAGSVAHELRHPLSVLTNAVYFLKMSLIDKDETTDEYLEIITVEIRTAGKIISDLLDFSRNQLTEQRVSVPTQVAVLVAEVLAEHSPPAGIELLREVEPDLSSIMVDPQQIKQVLTNLILNAYQAMPDGGALTVGSRQEAEGSVQLSVQDTGSGIAPEHREKLFEPLFTTKAKGIGLGLAICKTLIEANGGRIEVESIVGKGAAFTLTLPVSR